jgi:hypothetical protein
MSGLGSGMPKSVTMVTLVTVNFWAHVILPAIPFFRDTACFAGVPAIFAVGSTVGSSVGGVINR